MNKKKKIIPLNPMNDGTCRTIKNQYYKNGIDNLGRQGTFGASGVVEIWSKDDKQNQCDRQS